MWFLGLYSYNKSSVMRTHHVQWVCAVSSQSGGVFLIFFLFFLNEAGIRPASRELCPR